MGGGQIRDPEVLRPICEEIVAASPAIVDDYRAGKTKVLGALIGQVMRRTKGKADPTVVTGLFEEAMREG